MDDSGSSIDVPVNFNINVDTRENALPMVKAEAPPEEDMDQSLDVAVSTTPIIKKEPMDVTEEEEAQLLENAEFPSEPSASSPTASNSSATSPENQEVPTKSSEIRPAISLLWPGESVIKQEPDVEIDHDEGALMTEEEMASVNGSFMQLMQDPHPVMILKSERQDDGSSELGGGPGNEGDEDSGVDNWIGMVNRKAQCLVCNGVCRVTRNRKIPTLPFCKKCKKAYFYQLSHVVKGVRKQRSLCIRGGNCIIDHRFPREWCSVCHLRKFKAVLMKYAGFQRVMSFENEFTGFSEGEADDTPKRPHRFIRRRPRKRKEAEKKSPQQKPTDPVMIEKELIVRVQKLTKEDLEAYGISDPTLYVSTKQETLDYNWSLNNRDSAEYKLPPLQTKSKFLSSRVGGGSMLLPLPNKDESSAPAFKKRKVNNYRPKLFPRISLLPVSGEKKKSEKKALPKTPHVSDSVASIKVFVFTCGHACGLCNSADAKQWLKHSGINTTMPHNCADTTLQTSFASPQVHFGPAPGMQSKPETSKGHGSVHLRQLLDRPPGMLSKPLVPPVGMVRLPEVQFKPQPPPFLPAKGSDMPSKRPNIPVPAAALINSANVIGQPLPAFPGALQLRPDMPLGVTPAIPGQFHLVPIRFSPQLSAAPQGPLLLRVPSVPTSGNLQPQPLPVSLPIAPGAAQLNKAPPISPVTAPISPAASDVRLALAKSLTRPASNTKVKGHAPSLSLMPPPPPLSLISVPANIQLQSPILVTTNPDLCQATPKAASSSQASASTSQPLLLSSSQILRPKSVPNSVCLSTSLGPVLSQHNIRPNSKSAVSSDSLRSSAKMFSQLACTVRKSDSESLKSSAKKFSHLAYTAKNSDLTTTYVGGTPPLYFADKKNWTLLPKQSPAATQHTSDSSKPSAAQRPVSEVTSDMEHISGSSQISPHSEDTAEVSVNMNHAADPSCLSSDKEQMVESTDTENITGSSEKPDDMQHTPGSIQPEQSDDMKHSPDSVQPESSDDRKLSPDSLQPEPSEFSADSPKLSSDRENTAVSPEKPSDKELTLPPSPDKEHTESLLQLPSDKEQALGSLQASSDKENSAASPHVVADKEHVVGSGQLTTDEEHTASVSQPPSAKEHTAGSPQPPSDKENTVGTPQPPSDKEHTVGTPQPPSDKEHTAGSPQPPPDRKHSSDSSQLPFDKEQTNSPQPSSDKERTEGS